MSPEYLNQLADIADPRQLWRRSGLDQQKFSPEQKLQLDAGVALRRHAEHVRRMRELIGSGRSLVITPLSPNSTASTTIETPPKHKALIARQGGAA